MVLLRSSFKAFTSSVAFLSSAYFTDNYPLRTLTFSWAISRASFLGITSLLM